MELPELNALKAHLEAALREAFPGHAQRVSVDYPDSPNPLCFFEVDGRCFAQGSFWANNEYRVEAMNTQEATEIINESGMATSLAEAISVIHRFCDLAKASPESPLS
jgi:hypothetical protein